MEDLGDSHPPGRRQEAQPAGFCFHGVFDGESCERDSPAVIPRFSQPTLSVYRAEFDLR